MAIKDIQIEKKTITFSGGNFEVSGLSFNAITRLILDGEQDLDKAREIFEAMKKTDDGAIISEAAGRILVELPDLAARIVATAADEPETWQIVLRLPATVQLDALVEIGRLTFTEPDALKKFVANLRALTSGMKNLKA